MSRSLRWPDYTPRRSRCGQSIDSSIHALGGAAGWGTIVAIESLGAVVGGLFALRLRVWHSLVWSELLVTPAGLLLAVLAVPLSVPLIALVGFVVGVGFALGETLYVTAFQHNIPAHALSRISSFDWFGSVALNPIGYALIGPIAAAFGTQQTLYVAAALNVVVCLSVLLVPSVRRVRMTGPVEAVSPNGAAAAD